MKKFLIKFLLAISIVSSSSTQKINAFMGGSGPFEGVEDYAKSVTLGIETPASSGSGVIIGKKGDLYFFLTVGHVYVSNPRDEEYWVYTVEGGNNRKYRVNSLAIPEEFADKDIAIGSFSTKDQLPIALIFSLDNEKQIDNSHLSVGRSCEYNFELYDDECREYLIPTYQRYGSFNGRTWNDEWEIQGTPLIGGVSIPSRSITVPIFRFSTAQMQTRAVGNQRGYEAIYSATSTVPGMSGGGVFGTRVCSDINEIKTSESESSNWVRLTGGAYPGLIAIHGMSEEYGSSGGRSGTSLGIPLDLFTDYLVKNADKYGIPLGKKYVTQVMDFCMNKGMF